MLKFFLAIITILASIGMIKWGGGAMFWTGVGILSFIGLVVFLIITIGMVKIFKWTKTLAAYNILTITTIILLNVEGVIGLNVCLATTIPLSGVFLLIVLRYIGSKAQTSVIWSEIFSWLTGYRVSNIIKVDRKTNTSRIVKVQEVVEDEKEHDDIIAALRVLKFKYKESKEAADYAIDEMPDANTNDKLACALNYINSGKILKEAGVN